MKKDSFILYNSYRDSLEYLNESQLARLFLAIFDFNISGVVPDRATNADILPIFAMIAGRMKADAEKYAETCRRNRDNIQTRWDRERESQAEPDTAPQQPEAAPAKDETPEAPAARSKKKPIPPTEDEVKEYFAQTLNAPDEAAKFYAYYNDDSRKWHIKGGAKMKDWQRAARDWQRRAEEYKRNAPATTAPAAGRAEGQPFKDTDGQYKVIRDGREILLTRAQNGNRCYCIWDQGAKTVLYERRNQ